MSPYIGRWTLTTGLPESHLLYFEHSHTFCLLADETCDVASISWVVPLRGGHDNPTLVFFLRIPWTEEPNTGYSPWGHTEWTWLKVDLTHTFERLNFSLVSRVKNLPAVLQIQETLFNSCKVKHLLEKKMWVMHAQFLFFKHSNLLM